MMNKYMFLYLSHYLFPHYQDQPFDLIFLLKAKEDVSTIDKYIKL